jgi:hypothetical protein
MLTLAESWHLSINLITLKDLDCPNPTVSTTPEEITQSLPASRDNTISTDRPTSPRTTNTITNKLKSNGIVVASPDDNIIAVYTY